MWYESTTALSVPTWILNYTLFRKKPCYQNIFIHILTRYTSELEYWMGEIYIQAGPSSKLNSPLQQAELPEHGKYIWLQQGKV